MATNLEIISDALRELNVIAEIDTPSAEQGTHGLRKLNEMLEAWTENDIELGYFKQTSTSDDCPIPAWAERGVKAKLAIDLASTYGATVSLELATKANEGYQTILRRCISDKLEPANMNHMPIGQGHYGAGWDINSDSF